MIIDCGTCAHSPDRGDAPPAAISACGDCVVSVLLGLPDADIAVPHIADEHAAAVSVLASSGLIPPLRLLPRSQAS